ncbi:Cytochrome b5 [Dufourea novaeangliae]|uniref:Cytochrome b5 n=1 Tax=Dufourea novaeangliae TaxID=178035 RepID=A0A154PHT7_DUFNO|nr:Cytochrome b5 [Dufourea novaeangliae]
MSALTRYSLKDVAPKDGKNGADTWIVIHDMVYDVTRYKAEHPGGPELIDEYAGQDATIPFDDFGHSSEAIRMLKDYLIGELIQEDKRGNRKKKGSDTVKDKKKRIRSNMP